MTDFTSSHRKLFSWYNPLLILVERAEHINLYIRSVFKKGVFKRLQKCVEITEVFNDIKLEINLGQCNSW